MIMKLFLTRIGILIATLLGAAMFMVLGIATVSGTAYQLDFDSFNSNTVPMTGGSYTLEGGLGAQSTFGTAPGYEADSIGTTQYCGNSVIDDGEECDGNSVGSHTCETHGFTSGTIRCSSNCTIDTTICSTESSTQVGSQAGQGTGGSHRSLAGTRERESSSFSLPPNLHPSPVPTKNSSKQTDKQNNTTDDPKHDTFHHIENSEIQLNQDSEYFRSENSANTDSASSNVLNNKEYISNVSSQGATSPASNSVEDQELPAATAAADAIAIGSMSITQAGILARLGWIARIKNIYGVIPAFLS